MTALELQAYLDRHAQFSGWTGEWLGVPLEFRLCLTSEVPPVKFVGSVRAVVLRQEEVLLVHGEVPMLNVGGRPEAGETLEQALLREVGEESGWLVSLIGIIGFVHSRHLDNQRPDWGRPAPDWVDPMFAVEASGYDENLKLPGEHRTELVAASEAERLGVEETNLKLLQEALRLRAERKD